MTEKSSPDPDQEKALRERELRIQRQIAFASGIFQEDVTIRTVLESLAEGVVIIDTSGTVLLVNSRVEEMFGYSREELIGQPHALLVPERLRTIHEEHETEFFKEPRIRPMGQLLDLAGRRKDGSEFPVEISLSYLDTINGVIVLAFISDITHRRQYEDRLRKSEHLFNSFMLHLPAAAWIKDLNGWYVYANAEAERIFSVPLSGLQGKTDDEIFPPETARQFRENDQRVLTEDGSIRTIEVVRQADGVDHYSIVNKFAVPGLDGKTAFVAGVAFDITDRMRAEEALRHSEARYQALHRDNPAMIVTIDTDLTIISANPACASQLGYARGELEGRPVLDLFHEDDRTAVAEQLQRCLRNPERVYKWQFRKVRKDGNLLWVEEMAQAVHNLDGALDVLVVCQDITERKRAEEKIERLNTDLASRAAELEAANRELGAFNYSVSHDLRVPLTTVGGYSQMIQEICGKNLDEKCRGYLREIDEGVRRMSDLIDALLALSRLSHVEPQRKTVDLSAMAREVAGELRLTQPGRRITIRIADGVTVEGDPNLLRVVMENLLGNACKYTAGREEAVIEFGVADAAGQTACFIRDNGTGFAMADAEKLFIPFQRLPGADEFKGHGIGLATVQRIIQRHGGRIWAEGEPGKGATFWFTLG